jgi:hypothetical protein
MSAPRPVIFALLAVTLLAGGPVARVPAAEVHTNGTGGGPWSDPATWRDNALPGPGDSVVIASDDAVVFDLAAPAAAAAPAATPGAPAAPGAAAPDRAALACKDLYVDPDGLLTFKPGGRRVLALAGPLESYGLLKLDAAESADDLVEIRFTGADPAQRALKLGKGGGLLATGKAGLPDDRRTVPAPQRLGSVEAVAGTSLDLRDVRLDAITLKGSAIDNTGAKPNERLHVAGCLFTNGAAVALDNCDTPAVVNNAFLYAAEPLPFNAITLTYSPLAEVRGNRVSGKYTYGIFGYQQTDSVVAGNVLDGCVNGVYWCGTNDMIKGLLVRGAAVGVVVTSMTGALEDVTFDNCATGLSVTPATVQATGLRFVNVPKDAVRVHFVNGSATLVNCDVTPDQVKVEPAAAVTPGPRVVSMQHCVVAVTGAVPAGAAVSVATANPPQPLPKGAADLNVRNGPAAVEAGGLTPLPKSLKPLIVKSWAIEGDGRLTPAPQYHVSVTTRAAGSDQEPTVVKTVTVTPDAAWYRAKPNDPAPTLEIAIP